METKPTAVLENDCFWQILNYLDQLRRKTDVDQICEFLAINENELFTVVKFLNDLQAGFVFDEHENKKSIVPPPDRKWVIFELSLVEWLAFQANLPHLAEHEDSPFNSILMKKMCEIDKKYIKQNLFDAITAHFKTLNKVGNNKGISGASSNFSKRMKEGVSKIEWAMLKENSVELQLMDKIFVEIFPHRLVHLEGALSLVGEDINDGCIVFYKFENVKCVEAINEKGYRPHCSLIEVDDFIKGVRSLNGNEIRLILKFRSHEKLNLIPLYHYLGKPCLVANTHGDNIWAATVEPCEDLFRWIRDLDRKVDILDPAEFREEYRLYCEKLDNEEKKLAIVKRAS